jgi:hypothetical protein
MEARGAVPCNVDVEIKYSDRMTFGSPADRLPSDEAAIRRTLSAYCHLCDDGNFRALVEQFTSNGSFGFGQEVVTGHDEIRGWFERNQSPERRGKHLTLNTVIDVAGDHARAVSDFVFLRLVDGVPTPAVAGRYLDDLVRAGDRWVFQRRVAEAMSAGSV